ncbi:hypothetical protein [Paenibacillus wynnii]|uniref:hypothetical protein n=1 Tax=Paenibacillus wynnii TaxID=268407 RepID=UPI002793B8A1|nr:hypothetical protein [Paenibacillus wynnii]MDQ0193020.1 cobalamin biosynthesis Mg chelatase CobN [Paenibacillus wynnii]
MSDELSRVKSRKKQYKSEVLPVVKVKKEKQSPEETPKLLESSSGALTRASRLKSQSQANTSVKDEEKTAQNGEATPSRSQTYTSERVRLSKMFVNSLIVLFVILLISLLWWGIEGAPKLRTLLW